ncbi:hypothetical protein KHQ06_08150 [Nocardia tengchongensis]|uniref:Restriction endonuclease n=1 Tax=Nocardia tengchongensis TaxID=2055889 RepID=A0ABX8CSL7_9NOCA|nr:hypothetical protein [Nocardia tengchongensis]QVI22924.1 hypothetical protein KHQ06_08150 [Nocardia tengchongensis]
MTRTEETLHRLLEWRTGQASERLAAQILDHEGYEDIDPSHPQGGKDGGKDGTCVRNGQSWIYAVYFPRGQQTFNDIKTKFSDDLASARKHNPHGLAFVTNQEIRLSERDTLRNLGGGIEIEIYHLERVATILDRPVMAPVRKQYLDIGPDPLPVEVDFEVHGTVMYFPPDEAERALQIWLEHETTDQNAERIERWRAKVVDQWPESLDYLAAMAWPGCQFRVRNVGNAYLNHVQVVITVAGARGIECLKIEGFDQDKVLLPFSSPQQSLFAAPDMSYFHTHKLRKKDYPVSWENGDDSVVITIDLERLPPVPEWKSEDDDIVLVLRDLNNPRDLNVEWTVTAQGFGQAYVGPGKVIPVRSMYFAESLKAASGL